MWIGATNLNGPMTWVDGKPLTYTSWAGGQPAAGKKQELAAIDPDSQFLLCSSVVSWEEYMI